MLIFKFMFGDVVYNTDYKFALLVKTNPVAYLCFHKSFFVHCFVNSQQVIDDDVHKQELVS